MGEGDRTANAVIMDLPNEGTSSLFPSLVQTWTLQKRNRDARSRTPSSEDTSSTNSVAPELQPEVDGDEHSILEDERCADVGPLQEGFLLQELIFAHCKFLPRPTSQGHLMSRADWCALREAAGCECAILPIMGIAAS